MHSHADHGFGFYGVVDSALGPNRGGVVPAHVGQGPRVAIGELVLHAPLNVI